MPTPLPTSTAELLNWSWPNIEPHFQELAARPLTSSASAEWLADWSRLSECLSEMYARLYVATTVNTTDDSAQQRFNAFLDNIFPPSQSAEQVLKEKLLASALEPEGFAIPLRNMRAEAELFQEANLPLLADEQKIGNDYDKVIGAQTIVWDGQETTLSQLQPVFQDPDRDKREHAWRLSMERRLADRAAINALWAQVLRMRLNIAENAGFGRDYRAYRWRQQLRFDYSPEDSKSFQRAIEAVVVPAAERRYERRRQRLGLETLRPWDLNVDTSGQPPLRPYTTITELNEKTSAIFHQVDPHLGAYFDTMRREGLLDLDNRKGKAPGGYCTGYYAIKRPFIFMNAVGLHDDVQTLLHEGGHAFHVFETASLPYIHQQQVGMEFAEVASMGMELLAAPYLSAAQGGFYSEAEAARARAEHLEGLILFWPYMAVVDAFQHWVYENPDAALNGDECDAHWVALWRRFMPGVDWSGLEQEMMTGWHRKAHIHQLPFYYIEYGLAQLGAVQVWRNALSNQAEAVTHYRRALALGGTAPLPQLYAAAGARFAFDAGTLREAVTLIEKTLAELESTD